MLKIYYGLILKCLSLISHRNNEESMNEILPLLAVMTGIVVDICPY